MSSSINLAPANYNFNSSDYSSQAGKLGNHGNYGTVCNGTAASGVFVDTPGKYEPSISIMKGGEGYGFTGQFPGKIIGPDSGYLGIDKYATGSPAFARSGNVVAHWKNLTGGRRRRHRTYKQIGCKKMGGRRTRRKHKNKHSKRKHMSKRKRMHSKRMRGGDGPQPYSNIPQSFIQSFSSVLSAKDSGMANPVPMTAESKCAIIPRC